MSTDPVRRQAARTATLVAVPVALAVVGISLWVYGGTASTAGPAASATPQATSAVSMSATPLTEDTAAVCRTVVAKLPDAVDRSRGSGPRPSGLVTREEAKSRLIDDRQWEKGSLLISVRDDHDMVSAVPDGRPGAFGQVAGVRQGAAPGVRPGRGSAVPAPPARERTIAWRDPGLVRS